MDIKDILIKTKSSRHHYIPKFLIKGFENSDGQLYLYNKSTDKISSKLRSPKSVFFETDRNTIIVNEIQTSIIEDQIFDKLDNLTSKLINQFQLDAINTDLLSIENQGLFQFFIINLFWRLPLTDYAVSELIERVNFTNQYLNADLLKNNDAFRKILRLKLYEYTIEASKKYNQINSKYFVKMSEFKDNEFILGDNPILFKSTPSEFIDLNIMDYMFAVSSKRIYVSTQEKLGPFNVYFCKIFNALIINQSQNYIVSNNLKLLEESVNNYRKIKKENLFFEFKKELFSLDYKKIENV